MTIPVHKDSHSSQEPDSDSDGEDEGSKSKLPSWAQPKELSAQLQQQDDPTKGDAIFGQQIHFMPEACSLREIFGEGVTKKSHHRRGSSGCWDLDRLTQEEEEQYINSHAGA